MQLKCKYQGSGLCGNESVDISRNVCATDIVINDWKEHNQNKQVVGFTSAEQQSVEISDLSVEAPAEPAAENAAETE